MKFVHADHLAAVFISASLFIFIFINIFIYDFFFTFKKLIQSSLENSNGKWDLNSVVHTSSSFSINIFLFYEVDSLMVRLIFKININFSLFSYYTREFWIFFLFRHFSRMLSEFVHLNWKIIIGANWNFLKTNHCAFEIDSFHLKIMWSLQWICLLTILEKVIVCQIIWRSVANYLEQKVVTFLNKIVNASEWEMQINPNTLWVFSMIPCE